MQNGNYLESDRSQAFPNLPLRELPSTIEEHRLEGRRAIRGAVRNWVRRTIDLV